jgi:AcrR family transcriptional regulator
LNAKEKPMNRKKPGKPIEKDSGTSENREKILETALRLFTEKGFAGTPTSLISKEAGVATGTLFFYFPTKEELIDTLYRRVKSESALALRGGYESEKTVEGKFRRIGQNTVVWGIGNPMKWRFMEQFAYSPFVSTSAHEEGMSHFLFLQDLVNEGMQTGVFRDMDPTLLFCMVASSLAGLVARASDEGDPEKRAVIIEKGLEFVWNGVKA